MTTEPCERNSSSVSVRLAMTRIGTTIGLAPSRVTVTVAEPRDFAVTTPVALTVATRGFDVTQRRVLGSPGRPLIVGTRVSLSPGSSCRAGLSSWTVVPSEVP